jgi:hypothetical protein
MASSNWNSASNHLRLTREDVTFTSKLIDGRFPDYEAVIPIGADKTWVDREASCAFCLQRAAILSNEKYRGVKLDVSPAKLRIVAHNPEQEEAVEELEARPKVDGLSIGFNVNYLLDALSSLRGVNVMLRAQPGVRRTRTRRRPPSGGPAAGRGGLVGTYRRGRRRRVGRSVPDLSRRLFRAGVACIDFRGRGIAPRLSGLVCVPRGTGFLVGLAPTPACIEAAQRRIALRMDGRLARTLGAGTRGCRDPHCRDPATGDGRVARTGHRQGQCVPVRAGGRIAHAVGGIWRSAG